MSTSTTTTLANAPADIVESIAKYLDLSTLKALRLVSHDLHDQFSFFALRDITFVIYGKEEDIRKLFQTCSNSMPALYQYSRHLTVMTDAWYAGRYVDEEGLQGLYRTIEQFKNLTSFKIDWRSGGNVKEVEMVRVYEIQERVVDAVYKATEGMLDKLVINPWKQKEYELPKKLKEFKGLRELELMLDEYRWRCRALDRFGERSKRYDETQPHRCIPPSFKDTLQSIIRNSPELDIFKLKQVCAIDFHDATALFVHGVRPLALRSLSMKGIHFPCIIDARHSPFAHLQHLEILTPYATLPLDNLWKSLEVVGAQLKTLKTLQASLPFCSYLASYSGLQQLIIKDLDDVPECTHSDVTSTFFNDALPRHSSSLIMLYISLRRNLPHLAGWSFTLKLWMPALRSLTGLKSLHLYSGEVNRFLPRQGTDSEAGQGTGDVSDSDELEKPAYSAALVQAYQEVITHIESLPQLQTLEIIWPDKNWGCEIGRMKWLERCKRTLSQVVQDLRCINGVPRVLVLLSGRYNVRRMGDGSRWYFARGVPRLSRKNV